MPFVDHIVEDLQARSADRVVLESEQTGKVYLTDGSSTEIGQRLSFSEVNNLVTEILPDDQRLNYAAGEPVSFPYSHNGARFQIDVTQELTETKVSIARDTGAGPSEEAEGAVYVEPRRETIHYGGDGRRIEHIDELFRYLRQVEASDLHLCSGERPFIRVHGRMRKLEEYETSSHERLKELLWAIAPERNRREWDEVADTDFAYELSGVARFRCNYFHDRHGIGAVFRLIPSELATVTDLNLPQAMVNLCFLSKGLVVVTGPTGSGKSTTLAALVDHVNKHRNDHIITIEDPVEFVHERINCLLTQREVHVHTNSFSRALRAALREDPDIVLVGEMRDLETIAIAIETAETGHLVFGTLHTSTAASTVDRIIDQFPADQQEQIRTMLAESLKGVIAQTLCRTKDGRRAAAFEILIMDPACANLIREGKTYQIPSMMQIGRDRGCITMNDSLMHLIRSGKVEPKEAYIKAMDKAGLLVAFNQAGIKLDLSQVD